MKSKWIDFESPLANGIRAYIAYKRSLGRKFYTEEKNLRLLDRYLVEQKIIYISDITPDMLDDLLRHDVTVKSQILFLGTSVIAFGLIWYYDQWFWQIMCQGKEATKRQEPGNW